MCLDFIENKPFHLILVAIINNHKLLLKKLVMGFSIFFACNRAVLELKSNIKHFRVHRIQSFSFILLKISDDSEFILWNISSMGLDSFYFHNNGKSQLKFNIMSLDIIEYKTFNVYI